MSKKKSAPRKKKATASAARKKPAGKSRPARAKPQAAAPPARWNFRLYVAGNSPRSESARRNLQRLCEEHLSGDYHIEIVDLLEQPHLAKADQILAIPTLVRKIPEPIKRVIGDLSNADRAMVSLDLETGTAKGPMQR